MWRLNFEELYDQYAKIVGDEKEKSVQFGTTMKHSLGGGHQALMAFMQ